MNKTVKLNNGTTIPIVGLGTWRFPRELVADAVDFAITKAGYRHIDCASIYGNQKEIGLAFHKLFTTTDIKRDHVFITSKVWNTSHHPKNVLKECKQTLKELRLDYLDLYLMHWGIAFAPAADLEPIDEHGYPVTEAVSVQETWQAMEALVKQGLVKSIGVANFTTTQLIDLLTYAKIKPVVNQIELHPYLTQTALVDFCQYKDIAVTAYSPLGTPANKDPDDPILLEDRVIKKIANAQHKTPAQVLLRWAIQRGTIVIPKSVHRERIAENMDIFDFALRREDIEKINGLNRNHHFVNPISWWKIPYFS